VTNNAIGKSKVANMLQAEASRIVFDLGLHKETPREGLDFIELQLCRRAYWNVYNCDK
jgi:hypothetical protein